jgi:methylase of polypeptide subunit release factors
MTARPAGSAPWRALRTALIETGYLEHAQTARFVRGSFTRPDAVPAVLRRRGLEPRLAGLLDLFAYGAGLDDRAAARALAPATPEALARAGLLARRPGGWRSRLAIGGRDDVFVVGDIPRRGQRRDHVDGVTNAADVGRRLLVPVGSGRLLDLGTGSGIHALRAARGGGSAVGADINARALRLAAIGQQLSDVEDVQWRQGSWYEPVAGERFERIICVAPYVVSPDNEFTFRDGDGSGADPLRAVAAGATSHLAPGGCAQLMCCWGHGAEEDWRRAPMSWLAPRGADVLLVRIEEADPVHYAQAWNRPPMRTLGPAAHDRVMARWLSYYAREGYDRISFGALYVRRRARGARSGGSRAALDARERIPGDASGVQAGRALANRELLAGRRDDAALLPLALAIPDGQRVEQRLQHDGSRYRLRRASVRQAEGLGARVDVTAQVLEAVYRLDGRRTVAQALADVGVGRGAAGRARTAETLTAVRELLEAGLLEGAAP